MKKLIFAAIGLAILISGCYQQPQEAAPPPKTDFSDEAAGAIAKAGEAFVTNAKKNDSAALAESFYAEDAWLLPPGAEAVQGRAKIQDFFATMMKATPITDMKITTVEIEASGNLASEVGHYEMTLKPEKGKAITDKGKYVTTFRRQPDGSWKAIADIFNSSPPAPKVKK